MEGAREKAAMEVELAVRGTGTGCLARVEVGLGEPYWVYWIETTNLSPTHEPGLQLLASCHLLNQAFVQKSLNTFKIPKAHINKKVIKPPVLISLNNR